MPERFHKVMEDGVRQGAASTLAMVHFWFPGLVDIRKVVGGFLTGINPNDLKFLMPHLEDVADAVLAIAPLQDILRGPSLDH